ncbi:MAG: flagellar hook-associated protein FlgK [Rhodopseudomonas sp.]|nr:flagellar hook-associated protein FlgK [Rhodopseudomonas sp.]
MSLSQALNSAVAGLKVNQSSLALVSANVANAGTAGYVRKTVNQVSVAGNGTGVSVRISAIQRELDTYVQKQLRTENAGASYATTRADMFSRLQDVYGAPGSDSALETVFNNFTQSLQGLSSSPDDAAAQGAVVSAAQLLTQQLNSMSNSIQGLRSDAELGLSDAVTQANNAMSQIAKLNSQLGSLTDNDSASATLQDERDNYINQLSQLMDINVIQGDHNQLSIYTNSGIQLVGTQASTLAFDPHGTLSPNALWSADPTQRGVGTITLTSPTGNAVDLVQANAIRSGTIAAYLQMRDQDLPQAQSQLDAIASSMASSLSDKTTAGTAVTSGVQSGFDVDIGGLQSGNKITINYTDPLSNTAHTITLVRVDDPSTLPLSNDLTTNPNDNVYGIDFSAGLSTVYGQIATAIGSTGMVASNPGGTTLRILNDGPGNVVTVNGVSTTQTATTFNGGSSELPLFSDGTSPYTGAIGVQGPQSLGLAARITVNSAVVADPTKLVSYQTGTAAGDSTRPDFLYQQMTSTSQQFSPSTGIGSTTTPFTGSITTYLRQVISQQGQAASSATNLKQGQDVVLASLQQRFDESANVNIDEELTNLLSLQNSYAANARVLSTVKDMLDTLMQI